MQVTSWAQTSTERWFLFNADQFYINGELTYKGRYWKGKKIEGLLFNSRMVQGIFDDLNPETRGLFVYRDTKVWDADRNTNEFISSMGEWRDHGLLAFTLNLQGGSPVGTVTSADGLTQHLMRKETYVLTT